jgi:thiamine pyrophosphokinase
VATVLVFPLATASLLRAHLPPGARVIAIDGGAEACAQAGVRPDVIVGDMDSVSPTTLARFEAKGVRIERHPAAKRETDGALALRHAEGDDEIVFVGAGGGRRADHAFANLHLLARAGAGARARAEDEDATTWVVTPDRPLALRLPKGALVSVLPFGGRAEGVAYRGLEWALDDAKMETGDPYGVSNVAGEPPQEIRVRSGMLLVIVPK